MLTAVVIVVVSLYLTTDNGYLVYCIWYRVLRIAYLALLARPLGVLVVRVLFALHALSAAVYWFVISSLKCLIEAFVVQLGA